DRAPVLATVIGGRDVHVPGVALEVGPVGGLHEGVRLGGPARLCAEEGEGGAVAVTGDHLGELGVAHPIGARGVDRVAPGLAAVTGDRDLGSTGAVGVGEV